MSSLLRHAAHALTPVPLLFAACITLGLALASQAGFFGLPLGLILLSWLAKYAFVLLEAEAHGLPPPVLSVEMVNPFDERRPLGALLWLGTAAFLTGGVHSVAGAAAAAVFATLCAVAAPAALVLLAIEGSWLRALDPVAWVRVANGLGARYVVVSLAGIACLYAGLSAVIALPLLAAVAACVVLLLVFATLLGGAIWQRRDALGLDAVGDPARVAARRAREDARELDRVIDEAYGQLRAREPLRAWETLDVWLAQRKRTPEAHAALLLRTAEWPDARPAERLQRELVTRLLALGRTGDAVLSIEAAWRAGRRYSAASARELARLAGLARELGHGASADRLLAECPPDQAADPVIAALRTRCGVH